MRLRRAVTAFAILAAFVAARLPAQTTYRVSGVVTSAAGPVAGAKVTYELLDPTNTSIGQLDVLTAADGTFGASVPAGRIHLHVTPPAGSTLLPEHVFNIDVVRDVFATIALVAPVAISGHVIAAAGHSAAGKVNARSLSVDRTYSFDSADGSFELQVAPDLYSLDYWPGETTLAVARATVDTRGGHAAPVVLQLPVDAKAVPLRDEPPVAALISISAPDPLGVATVRGEAGSVTPLSTVLVANLQTAQTNFALSAADGSFSTRMFAPAGSFIEVKHDPTGRYLTPLFPWMEVPAGTILHVAPDPSTLAAVGQLRTVQFDIHRFPFVGDPDPGQWMLTAPFDAGQWRPGSSFTIGGTASLFSKDFDAGFDPAAITMSAALTAEEIFDAEGRQHQVLDEFTSVTLTPTGLPIDNVYSGPQRYLGAVKVGPFHRVAEGRIEASWSVDVAIPSDIEPGHYRLLFGAPAFTNLPPAVDHRDIFPPATLGVRAYESPARIVKFGNPRKGHLISMVAMNDAVQGARGVIADEDRGTFSLATHVTMPSDAVVLPMLDPRTGARRVYRLEPFVPIVSTSNGNLPDPPQIPIKPKSGNLSVRVVRPNGTIDDLGSAAIVQNRNGSPASQRGFPISGTQFSTGHVSDLEQLTTRDSRFDYRFTTYGRHRVIVSGFVEDDWGNAYDLGGTYTIDGARPLEIHPAVIPGTPLQTGNALSSALTLQPPVPASIAIRVTHMPDGDPSRAVTWTISGRANRFGYFSGASSPPFIATSPGEYRWDATATYTDAAGTQWEGNLTWGSVVETPNSPVRAHGRRGFQNAARRDAWLFVRNADRGAGHLMYPFHQGDVMWMEKNDNASDATTMTVEDPEGTLAARVRTLLRNQVPDLDARIVQGEIPLQSACYTAGCARGYYYGFASRPDLRIRELVSEDNIALTYWRFHDYYEMQAGNGANGDLPNDFKFQFGGAVFRDPQSQYSYYGAYGSFFVLLPDPDTDGGRVFPPFQGNGGGPSGGPLFTLKGKPIDLFFHPTAVRPGTILERGDVASFAGYAAPTLPAKIEVVVTSPSGAQRTIRGQANKVGYFYDPATDFAVAEEGIWKAKVAIVFDGVTSAGQVSAPFPSGDVLGSREGEFFFYVVVPGAQELAMPDMPAFVRPADGPIAFRPVMPAGLTNAQLTCTATMPGFILEETTSSALSCDYDARALSLSFPNLDLYDEDGYAGMDPVTLSFFVSGTDAHGVRRSFARQIVLQGEELQMPAQRPAPDRRRSATH